jgi:pyruvate/2-oxoglutarate dehydrogenase complex dihydrolipoamide dehydrogenase (E3) component
MQWGQKSRLLNLCKHCSLLNEDISKQMERSMKKAGVKIMTNSSVEKIDTSEG